MKKFTGRTGKGRRVSKMVDGDVVTGNVIDKGKLDKTYSERNIDIDSVSFTNTVQRKTVASNDVLEQYYECNDTVGACVDVISFAASGSGYNFVPYIEDDEIKKNHKIILRRAFDDINEDDEGDDLFLDTFYDLLTFGDSYWERVVSYRHLPAFMSYLRHPKGNPWDVKIPYKFYKISAYNTKPVLNDFNRIVGYEQKDWSGNVVNTWSDSQIIHFRMPSPFDEVQGLAPSATLGNTIAADIFANDYNGKFFENNATPRLHIDLGNVGSEELKQFVAKAEQKLKGQAHKNLVTRGGVVVTPIGITNTDMDFMEYQRHLIRKIMAKYRVQPIILGYANEHSVKEETQIALFKFLAVDPIRKIVASRINKRIIRALYPSIKAKFTWNPIDRLDIAQQSEIDNKDLEQNIKSINEVRVQRGLNRVKWGNDPLLQPGQKYQKPPANKEKEKEKDKESKKIRKVRKIKASKL